MIIVDTNMLIELLKNNTTTIRALSGLQPPLFISMVTTMELYYGTHDKQEVKCNVWENFPSSLNWCRVSIEESIFYRALALVHDFAKSHFLDAPDSLIAVSVLRHQATLFTYNVKDFRFIPEIKLLEY